MKFDYSVLRADAMIFDSAMEAAAGLIAQDREYFKRENITSGDGVMRANAAARALEDALFYKVEHKAAVVRVFREAEDIFNMARTECNTERLYTLGADLARVAQIAFCESVKEGNNFTLKGKIEDYAPLFWEGDREAVFDGLWIMSYVTEQYIAPDKWSVMGWGFEDLIYGRYGTPFSKWYKKR